MRFEIWCNGMLHVGQIMSVLRAMLQVALLDGLLFVDVLAAVEVDVRQGDIVEALK
jgi:hypothetical protein